MPRRFFKLIPTLLLVLPLSKVFFPPTLYFWSSSTRRYLVYSSLLILVTVKSLVISTTSNSTSEGKVMSELASMVPDKDGGADSQAQFSCIPSYKNELQKWKFQLWGYYSLNFVIKITFTLRTLWVPLQTNLPSKSSPLTLPTIPMLNPIAFIDFELNGISFNFPLIWAVSLCFGTRLSVPVLYAVWSLAAVSPEALTSVNSNFELIIPSVGILSMSNSKSPSFSLAPA